MSFVIYDLVFLALFTILTVLFLYRHKSKLKRQGILYLYHTNIGLKIIERVSKKYASLLKPLQYVVVACGYVLMAVMLWLLVRIVNLYSIDQVITQTKIPPIAPLIPYLPSLFKADYLPPLYFTYWIVILAVVAITHEFAHGIFARLNKITVHSTGFGFLGPFLAAFVEPDEKQMQKASKFSQLAILAAGTFANILMTILFGVILLVFFAFSFSPVGVVFSSFSASVIVPQEIISVDGMPISSLSDIAAMELNDSLHEVVVDETTYYLPASSFSDIEDAELLYAYDDTPALQASLQGAIVEIGGTSILNREDLQNALARHAPGDEVEIVTFSDDERISQTVTLAERDGRAYLGVGFAAPPQGKISSLFYSLIANVKDPYVQYEPAYGDFAWFIYHMLWWMVVINFSVALMNMLPVGIFDGGRFFYLTIWGITGKEKIGRYAFRIATYAILAVFVWLTLRWFWVYF